MDVTGAEAAAQTEVNLVSPFAHPRSARDTRNPKSATFGFRQVVTSHPWAVALSCLALGGTIAAVILQRRRGGGWEARIERLRQAWLDAANGVR